MVVVSSVRLSPLFRLKKDIFGLLIGVAEEKKVIVSRVRPTWKNVAYKKWLKTAQLFK
jgi:hypothetical protein